MKKTKKNKKYAKHKTKKYKTINNTIQKGGEEHMSNLNITIVERQKAKRKKQLLLQTLVKLIIEKEKKNKQLQTKIISR